MSAARTRTIFVDVPRPLRTLAATALLLEKLDRLPRACSAEQYRAVVRRAAALLAEAESDPALVALLDASPALAELWENCHYETSGLCRAPLPAAVDSEREAKALLARLRR